MNVKSNVLEAIGNSPLIRLKKIEETLSLSCCLFAKCERFNPSGSVKDRAALSIIEKAEKEGLLKEGDTIVEATSGNMGISLAMIAASKGYKIRIYMPENTSKERKLMMEAYGAEVILTPKEEGMNGAVIRAEKEASSHTFLAHQFENLANPEVHKKTGEEIYNDLDGKIDVFLAGIGTGGTISGTAKYLKQRVPSIKIIGVEPASSPLLTKGMTGSHALQGLGPNFIPKTLDSSLLDEVIDIEDEEGKEGARMLAKEEGILAGISSGAALMGALKYIKKYNFCGNIVIVLPDNGERYLSVEGLYGK